MGREDHGWGIFGDFGVETGVVVELAKWDRWVGGGVFGWLLWSVPKKLARAKEMGSAHSQNRTDDLVITSDTLYH